MEGPYRQWAGYLDPREEGWREESWEEDYIGPQVQYRPLWVRVRPVTFRKEGRTLRVRVRPVTVRKGEVTAGTVCRGSRRTLGVYERTLRV